jgi:hypothetical protein
MSVKPQGALVVGSVPLSDTTAVMRAVGSTLGARMRRIPDGETGERLAWIGWQGEIFAQHPSFEPNPPPPGEYSGLLGRYRLREDTRDSPLEFPALGYATAAARSYDEFVALRDEGVIAKDTKFQVSLPTPVATISQFVLLDDRELVEPAYERAMLDELSQIAADVPAEDLAIQWDVAVEIAIWEGVGEMFTAWWDDVEQGLIDRFVRLGAAIPGDVELGYHLCYGDYQHHHFKEPQDLGNLVTIYNRTVAALPRSVQWLHVPVPRERVDTAYFEPGRDLKLADETEIYLGLVHLTDGEAGTLKRIAAAATVFDRFGVAAECGLGRRPASSVQPLLDIHASVADPF